jgi:hypothetical protein
MHPRIFWKVVADHLVAVEHIWEVLLCCTKVSSKLEIIQRKFVELCYCELVNSCKGMWDKFSPSGL